MAFEMRHPVGMTTNTFNPGKSFEVSRSGQRRVDPVIGQEVDQLLYSYRFGAGSVWIYTRAFDHFTQADMAALETFLDAVDREPFEFQDGACGPVTAWTTVELHPDSYIRQYDYAGGQRQAIELILRGVP